MTRKSQVASRKLAVLALLSLGLWLSLAAAPAVAQVEVSVEDLLADPAAFDGTTITVEGELIGDYGFRPGGSMWTQLNDDSYARAPVVEGGALTGSNLGIGVRMSSADGERLDPPGGYRVRGPIVRATGIWKYHDPDRGGETYLDATSVETAERGEDLEEGADWWALGGGIALLIISGGVWWQYVAARDRQ
jgi:hypothetical protein